MDCVLRFTSGGLCDEITANPLEDVVTLDLDCVAVVGKDFVRSEWHVSSLLRAFGDFSIEAEVVTRLHVTVFPAHAAIVI